MKRVLEELVGEPVQHKVLRLGKGKIQSIIQEDDKNLYIQVCFESTPDKIISFPFPRIFMGPEKLMYSNSAKVISAVAAIEGRYNCSLCGYQDDKAVELSGRMICRKCYSELVQCYY